MEPVYEVALVTAAAVVAAALFYFVCRKIFLLKFLSRRGSWCVPCALNSGCVNLVRAIHATFPSIIM